MDGQAGIPWCKGGSFLLLISTKGIHLNILNHIGPEGRQSHYIYYSETIERFIRQQGDWIAAWIKESKNEKYGKEYQRICKSRAKEAKRALVDFLKFFGGDD